MSVEYYGYECGVLLKKGDSEFDFYSNNNPKLPYGFYDEDQGFCGKDALDEVRDNLRKYVEDGVDMTYAIISFQGTCKEPELKDILTEQDINSCMEYTFFKNKSEVVYSACKIEGKITEGFLEKLIEEHSLEKPSLSEQITAAAEKSSYSASDAAYSQSQNRDR